VAEINKISVDGIVYTSVLNPADRRKNWQDMVTAFCFAFKETSDATLLIKFVTHDFDEPAAALKNCLYQLSPFNCRVVGLHSFLSDEDYQSLIRATSYYVNTSHGEGQCLPLMEFMSCGVPAIAPATTALADYIDSEVAFVIQGSDEITHWQHDSRRRYRALQTRIDWSSLVEAYLDSYAMAKTDASGYRDMSQRASERLRQHCSQESVRERLSDFLNTIVSQAQN